jgi:murein peptide amidase A
VTGRPSRRRVLCAAAWLWATASVLPPLADATGSVRPPHRGARVAAHPSRAGARVIVLGHSVQGRPIVARSVGSDSARRRILLVGCVHGNECAGLAIIRALSRRHPVPGVQLWLVGELNPDGTAAGTRQNAHGVDLNRNFPYHWHRVTDATFYSGPRPLSEPESRGAVKLIRALRPAVTVWYHQQRNLVDMSGGDRGMARRYAQLAHLRATCLPFLPGTATSWENHTFPATTSFVVELPAGRVGRHALRHHLAAVTAMERGQRTGARRSCAP